MAIINTMPVLRANYCAEPAAAPHLHEGKAATFDEEGKLALATAGDDALGVIVDPDGANVATCGNPTGAGLLLRSFGGVFEVQLGTIPAPKPAGTPLYVSPDGTFSPECPGEALPVCMLAEAVGSTAAGQMVRAVFRR